MPLTLRIENMDTLPDGGAIEMMVDRKGLDIGRDAYLDWSLPDQQRFISGKHCEVHFRNGYYWLHDVSRNGTFLNGSTARPKEPHKLATGDRITIGQYIIAVTAEGPEIGDVPASAQESSAPPAYQDGFWDSLASDAPAAAPNAFNSAPAQSDPSRRSGTPVQGDALEGMDWESDVLSPVVGGSGGGSPSGPGVGTSPPAATGNPGLPPLSAGGDPGLPAMSAGGDPGLPPLAGAAEQTPPPGAPQPAPPVGSAPPAPSAGLDAGVFDVGGGGDLWGAGSGPATPPARPEPEDEGDFILSAKSMRPAGPPPAAFAPSDPPMPVAPPATPPPADAGDPFGSLSAAAPAPAPATPPAGAGAGDPGLPPLSSDAPAPEPAAPSPAPAPTPPAPTGGGLASQWGAPAEQPAAAPSPAPSSGSGDGSVVEAFARGAGIPASVIAQSDPAALAEELGQLMRMVADNLKGMLRARDETRGVMRVGGRTMIGAAENNPLKHSPTVDEALKIMFGPSTPSYLGLKPTIEKSFRDLNDHQMRTFSAMQQALKELFEDLSPEGVAGATPEDGGLAALVSSRRAKLWDIYVERYKSKAGRHEQGMLGAFMLLFAEIYDDPNPR